MGILKDLLLGSDKETRPEKTERVDIRGLGSRKEIYDKEGHITGELRWNPHTDRWDKLDTHGNVTGHIERDMHGDMVHKDCFNRITHIDRRESNGSVGHYDGKGKKTGYTTRDYSNNLTIHTYIDNPNKSGNKKRSSTGFILLDILRDAVDDSNK